MSKQGQHNQTPIGRIPKGFKDLRFSDVRWGD